MPNGELTIDLAPLDVKDAASVFAIRLVEAGAAARLVTSAMQSAGTGRYETAFVSHDLGEEGKKPQPLLSAGQLLRQPPGWDVLIRPVGGALLAIEIAGGAVTYVSVREAIGKRHSLKRQRVDESVTRPRFTRRSEPAAMPAVAAVRDFEHVVVYPAGGEPPYANRAELCAGIEAQLVQRPQGLSAVLKAEADGREKHTVTPGTLSVVALDGELRPQGKPVALLGGRCVYDFDADRLGDGLGVLAATADALYLAVQPAGGKEISTFTLAGDFDAANLSRTCLLACGDRVHLAAVEAPLSDEARVLVGKVALEDVS